MSTSKFVSQVNLEEHQQSILAVLHEIASDKVKTHRDFQLLIHRWGRKTGKIFSKNDLIFAYKKLKEQNHPDLPQDSDIIKKIQLKPIRTLSGVTTVTVLTKPFPCPGKCIFCPNDVRMPKSYLADEPGAQRALRNQFDPYLQTYNRLQALSDIGHDTNKIEVIILGGTWSYYSEGYQIWFIKRIFEAMNDFGEGKDQRPEVLKLIKNQKWQEIQYIKKIFRNSREVKGKSSKSITDQETDTLSYLENNTTLSSLTPSKGESQLDDTYNKTIIKIIETNGQKLVESYEKTTWEELFEQHKINETAKCRCVGLVIETRPDNISPAEVIRIRKLGCTKTQIGFQSLNDEVLAKNHRGHDVAATRKAVKLLRQAGFKIHAHWMANLYGSNPEQDIQDYQKIFEDIDFKPDELKIYPCSLIETAELMDYYHKGLWRPYTYDELLRVVSQCIANTPQYCRLTRVIRDIPGTDIVTGNKITNFREVAEKELDRLGIIRQDIRSREIKNQTVTRDQVHLDIVSYQTSCGEEQFLQFITQENKIVGFLRLHLPTETDFKHPFIDELSSSAIIREIHIYGKAVNIGQQKQGEAQHLGLGSELIEIATKIAQSRGYKKLAVISAIGTREYYRKRGFKDGELYQFRNF